MQENTNKAIALNSIILYIKMGINTICSLLITRFALQALGVSDFGLFSVLGGIVSFIAIFNTILLSTTNRFIAVAIGKNNIKDANIQFNVCLLVHIAIALVTLLLAVPVGNWYIDRFINYEGDISNAYKVFNISIVASIIAFVGIPYNGLLMAKERFWIFSLVDILAHLIKLLVSYLLLDFFTNKLLVYTVAVSILSVVPIFIYMFYSYIKFSEIVKFRLVKEKSKYQEIFKFSAWVSIGAVSVVAKNQGAALLVNAFFNTIMNTALGIANSVNSYISLFAQNVAQPMSPQITKSYASGDRCRTDELLIMSTKFSFLMMLLVSIPFLVSPEWIIQLWLGEIPPYVVSFTVLLIIDNLVQSLNSGISNVIFASGKISLYQVCISVLNVLSIVLAYICLKLGMPVISLVISYIIVSLIKFVVIQIVLNKTLQYNSSLLIKNSYIPSLAVSILFVPILFLRGIIHPVLLILVAMIYVLLIIVIVGMNKKERNYIVRIFNHFK